MFTFSIQCELAVVHWFFIFHSTLHSSQSSRFRFRSHPAASKSAAYQKYKLISQKILNLKKFAIVHLLEMGWKYCRSLCDFHVPVPSDL